MLSNLLQKIERPLQWNAIPSPKLQPYIESYSGLIIPPSTPLNFGHRSSPSGNVFLQIVFGSGQAYETNHAYKPIGEDKERPKQAIILPRSVSWRAKLEESPDFVLVQFKTGMAAPFLNLSLSELNTWENANDLWSSAAMEQLNNLKRISIQDRVHLIEQVLLERLEQSTIAVDQTVNQALHLIRNGRGCLEMQSLADQLHISGRQLRRKFQHHVGLTPKQYNKIVRFHCANQLIQQHSEMTLTEVAHHSGYFDLAHFTNAIQEITGIPPSQMSKKDRKTLQDSKRDIDFVSVQLF